MTTNTPTSAGEQGVQPTEKPTEQRPRLLILVRHGQATFNVSGQHPGQLPGIPLTDEGRRQAHTAAVALAALPISAVVSSPLERARETAEIIARGWDLPIYLDGRLKDTNVGPFAGKTGADLKDDPAWKQFQEHPDHPPADVESLADVEKRAVAAVEDVLRDPGLGSYIVVVAHADVVKLVLGHFLNITTESARHLGIGNASLSALLFHTPDQPPEVLALNWSPLPHWLHVPVPLRAEAPPSALPADRPTNQAPATSSPPTTAPTPGGAAAGTPAQPGQRSTAGTAPSTPSGGGAGGHLGASTPIPKFLDFI